MVIDMVVSALGTALMVVCFRVVMTVCFWMAVAVAVVMVMFLSQVNNRAKAGKGRYSERTVEEG